jgi:hypothetical protein
MRLLKKSLLATTISALLLAALAGSATAGPPGSWTQLTGPVGNIAEPGIARTADGTLHLTWPNKVGLGGTVNHSTLSADARSTAGPEVVFSYPDGINNRMALVATGGALRAFFAGLFESEANPLQGVLASSTSAPGGGAPWTSQATAASNGTPGGKSSVYAGDGIAAVVGTDGIPVTAWGSPGAGFHIGTTWTDPDVSYADSCCVYGPGLAVDSVSGETVLAWQFIQGSAGIAYKTIRPSVGAVTAPPGANNAATSTRTAVTGRIGAPGIYLGYLKGTNQFMSDPAIVRTGSTSATTFRGARGAQHLGLVAAPGGRLWIFWARQGKITAIRSNTAATRFGAAVTLKPPAGSDVIYNLAGEGSLGPLDLIALIDKNGAINEWHQRILPGLTLSASSASGKIKYRVTDAGEPVKNAKVKAGGKWKKTNAAGRTTIRLRRGKYKATATKTGFAKASRTARSR